MKNRFKRVFSMLLLAILLVSLFPGGIWAEEKMPEVASLSEEQFGQQKLNPMSEIADQLDLAAIDKNQAVTEGESDASEGFYQYSVVGGLVTIEKYHGPGGDVTIPSTLGGFPVTKIGVSAFSDLMNPNNVTNISLPEGLTSIGDYAFFGCSRLTSISLPESLTGIGYAAFSNCAKLTDINLPESCTSIDSLAFQYCSSLTNINLPEGLTSIDQRTFLHCSNLTAINLPESLTSIGCLAFSWCGNLTNISLPESITSIESSAFDRCTSLRNIVIPESVISVGSSAFVGCSSLKSIQFNSASTEIISADQFAQSKTIPQTTTIIGYDPSTAKDYANKYGNHFRLIGESSILESISITSVAAKYTYNIGESLDLGGLEVTGTYSDGTTRIEIITPGNITGFDSTKVEKNQLITITVNGKTVAYVVQIKEVGKEIDCYYRTHVQNEGWQDWKRDGTMSGTSGKGLRLEGIEIKIDGTEDLGLEYSTHVQNIGWQDFVKDGAMSGTSGKSLRLEAIRINLTEADANKYDIYYQVHAQNYGWLDWAKNGESAGTAGFGDRLEAIRIAVVPKGDPAPGATTKPFVQK